MTIENLKRRGGRFSLLFLVLFLLVLFAPFVTREGDGNPVIVDVLYAGIPLAVMFAIGRRRRAVLVISLLVGVPAIVAALQGQLTEGLLPEPMGAVIGIVFYGFACWLILKHIAKMQDVTADTIFGALSLYMLIGITFMNGYVIAEFMEPGSFYVGAAQNPTGHFGPGDLLYFSYVTLTTLGYGDITPVLSIARSLAVLEAAIGVMFMAVVIGRVVGIYASKHGGEEPAADD